MRANRFMLCLALLAGWFPSGCREAAPSRPKPRAWWDQNATTPTPQPASPTRAEESKNLLAGLFGPSPSSGGAKDGNYTILLSVCRGPGSHVKQAKYYKEATERHAGWKHLFIVHREHHSLLYWGKYKTMKDAQPNLKKAKVYRTPAKLPVYAKAILVPIPGKEDPGPAEWKLTNTPPEYVYSVLVAEFYDVVEAGYMGRRKFAVDYCRQLRQKNLPAYYKHDPGSSIVAVGLFDRSAVQFLRKGNRVERVLRDKRIRQLFKQFPNIAVNGRQKLLTAINPKTRKTQKIPAPTYLMKIPREPVGPTAVAGKARPAGQKAPPEAVTCELKVVQVSNGTVVTAVRGVGRTDRLPRLAQLLVSKIDKDSATKGKPLAVADFRDRGKKPRADGLCEELAYRTMAALLREGWFEVKQRVSLRKALPEKDLDNPDAVKIPKVRQKLSGLEYVVMGGVVVSELGGS
ncbi:MAG TPA: hypothetical protein VM031_00440 [Phycisphaerae bacterium]|nr:hypothetical protein [Phycisphaerae bacterium]